MNHLKKLLLLSAVLLSCAASAQTTLAWDANNPNEFVEKYVIEHRQDGATEWTRVEVHGTLTQFTLPESTRGRWFRMAAVNAFGASEWTDSYRVPSKVRALRLVLEITP